MGHVKSFLWTQALQPFCNQPKQLRLKINPFADKRGKKELRRFNEDDVKDLIENFFMPSLQSIVVCEGYKLGEICEWKELHVNNFWDYLYSADWEKGFALRIHEGELLSYLSSNLKEMTSNDEAVTYQTRTFLKYSKPKMMPGEFDSKVLIEYTYYGKNLAQFSSLDVESFYPVNSSSTTSECSFFIPRDRSAEQIGVTTDRPKNKFQATSNLDNGSLKCTHSLETLEKYSLAAFLPKLAGQCLQKKVNNSRTSSSESTIHMASDNTDLKNLSSRNLESGKSKKIATDLMETAHIDETDAVLSPWLPKKLRERFLHSTLGKNLKPSPENEKKKESGRSLEHMVSKVNLPVLPEITVQVRFEDIAAISEREIGVKRNMLKVKMLPNYFVTDEKLLELRAWYNSGGGVHLTEHQSRTLLDREDALTFDKSLRKTVLLSRLSDESDSLEGVGKEQQESMSKSKSGSSSAFSGKIVGSTDDQKSLKKEKQVKPQSQAVKDNLPSVTPLVLSGRAQQKSHKPLCNLPMDKELFADTVLGVTDSQELHRKLLEDDTYVGTKIDLSDEDNDNDKDSDATVSDEDGLEKKLKKDEKKAVSKKAETSFKMLAKGSAKKPDRGLVKKPDRGSVKKPDQGSAKKSDRDSAKKPDRGSAKKPDRDSVRKSSKDSAKRGKNYTHSTDSGKRKSSRLQDKDKKLLKKNRSKSDSEESISTDSNYLKFNISRLKRNYSEEKFYKMPEMPSSSFTSLLEKYIAFQRSLLDFDILSAEEPASRTLGGPYNSESANRPYGKLKLFQFLKSRDIALVPLKIIIPNFAPVATDDIKRKLLRAMSDFIVRKEYIVMSHTLQTFKTITFIKPSIFNLLKE